MADKANLAPLTSLRFVAAVLVLFHHYFLFEPGHVGVTFFFVLSGFILSFNYTGQITTASERQDFWSRRVARIWPTHVLTFIFSLPLALPQMFRHGIDISRIAKSIIYGIGNLLLLQSWMPVYDVYFGFNNLSWSISDEAFFYLLFPLLATRFERMGLRALSLLIVCWAAVLVLAAMVWSCLFTNVALNHVPTHYAFYINPGTRLLEFALGMVLGMFHLRSPRYPASFSQELAVLGFAGSSLLVMNYVRIPSAFALSLVFVPAAAALVHVFARGGGLVSQLLSRPVLVRLGEASFMIYMTHELARAYLEPVIGRSVQARFLLAAVVIVTSIALHRWFERPLQRLVVRPRRLSPIRVVVR